MKMYAVVTEVAQREEVSDLVMGIAEAEAAAAGAPGDAADVGDKEAPKELYLEHSPVILTTEEGKQAEKGTGEAFASSNPPQTKSGDRPKEPFQVQACAESQWKTRVSAAVTETNEGAGEMNIDEVSSEELEETLTNVPKLKMQKADFKWKVITGKKSRFNPSPRLPPEERR